MSSSKAFTIPSVFTAIDKFTVPVQKMATSVSQFGQKAYLGVLKIDRAFNNLLPGISETTKQMLSFLSTAALAGAIIGGIAFSGKAIMDYETAVQSFRTIVSDLNDADFSKYEKKIREVAIITKKSTIDVAKGFEMIAGLNADFAKTEDSIGSVTQAAITLSKASRDDLGRSASNLTGILNQFNLQAKDSDRVINVLAAGQAVGASTITQTADAFTVVGAVLKASNTSLEQGVGLIEVLASKQIQSAEAGTALRGSIIQLQKAGLGYKSGIFQIRDALIEYNQKLSKLKTAKEKDAYADKVFGTINRTSGTILATNIDLLDKYTIGVTGTSEATKAAEINSNTLANRLDELKNKWVSIITTSDRTNKSLNLVKKTVVFLTNNLETIVTVFGVLIAVILSFKLLLLGFNVVIKTLTAAQWLYNAAMSGFATELAIVDALIAANPIGLLVIGISAAITAIILITKYWNEWGAAVSLITGPLAIVISMVQTFGEHWEKIKVGFSEYGIVAGLKEIGKWLLSAVIYPVQQLLKIIGQLTGSKTAKLLSKESEIFVKWMNSSLMSDKDAFKEMGKALVDTYAQKTETKEIISPRSEAMRQMVYNERTNNAKVAIEIGGPLAPWATVKKDEGSKRSLIPITTSTHSAGL
jgi:TP901 family phage tail tape measure protein